jgi:hypothetical protein
MINSGVIFVLAFIAFFTAFVIYILKNRDKLRNTGSDRMASPDTYDGIDPFPDSYSNHHADASHDADFSGHDGDV